jgi:hypothetical protein
MTFMPRSRLSRSIVLTSVAVAAFGLTACAPGGPSEPANMIGTWTGEYTYPLPDGSVAQSTQTIVIERQEGASLWGYEEWTGPDGRTERDDLVGQIGLGFTTFVLTEEEGFFSGVVNDDRMAVRYIRLGEANTTFEAELTRSTSSGN